VTLNFAAKNSEKLRCEFRPKRRLFSSLLKEFFMLMRTPHLLVLLLLAMSASLFADAPQAAFSVENLRDGEELRYSVPILRGSVPDAAATVLTVTNLSSQRETRELSGLCSNGKFKVLADLVPGPNDLVLKCGAAELKFHLTYTPQTNPYFVRAIYITDSTGDTHYQTPLENDPQDYADKISTALLIMQSFTAERMNDLGFGRRTFNVELDEHGKVRVHLFKGPAPAETYYAMNDQAWYANVAARLDPQFPTKVAKNYVVAAYTRWDGETKKAKGHTALGGGGQGLFGSGSMFCWPSQLKDVQSAFMNATPIDTSKVMDDSAGRHTFWGAASTTLGACLHEVGHAFGLPHTREPLDIMTRGFDHFNRAFTLVDAPSGQNKEARTFKADRIACFAPISATSLLSSRWFASDAREWRNGTGVRIERLGDEIVFTATEGVRFVSFAGKEGEAFFHVAPKDGEKEIRIPAAKLGDAAKEGDVLIRAVDGQGNATALRVSELARGPFIQDWQFAPETKPWPDTKVFPALSDDERAALEAAAKKAPLRNCPSRTIDLLPIFTEKQEGVAAYALRTLHVEKETKVKLLTGSDDGLRAWLNGKLVQSVLALRGTNPDSESADITLAPGDNTLLVEITQGRGGWSFCARLEKADGTKVRVRDDGTLE
jgi:hypothetical protein